MCPEAAGFPKKGATGAGCRLYYELAFIVKGRASYVKRPLPDFCPFLLPPHQLAPTASPQGHSILDECVPPGHTWALKVKGSALPFPFTTVPTTPWSSQSWDRTSHPESVWHPGALLRRVQKREFSPREFREGADSLAQES